MFLSGHASRRRPDRRRVDAPTRLLSSSAVPWLVATILSTLGPHPPFETRIGSATNL